MAHILLVHISGFLNIQCKVGKSWICDVSGPHGSHLNLWFLLYKTTKSIKITTRTPFKHEHEGIGIFLHIHGKFAVALVQ